MLMRQEGKYEGDLGEIGQIHIPGKFLMPFLQNCNTFSDDVGTSLRNSYGVFVQIRENNFHCWTLKQHGKKPSQDGINDSRNSTIRIPLSWVTQGDMLRSSIAASLNLQKR